MFRPHTVKQLYDTTTSSKERELSQAVFAMYLNISPAMVRSLEQGKRQASGVLLKLLNIVDHQGIAILV